MFVNAHAQKRGGEGRKGSGDKAYPSAGPEWNAAVGVKYNMVAEKGSDVGPMSLRWRCDVAPMSLLCRFDVVPMSL